MSDQDGLVLRLQLRTDELKPVPGGLPVSPVQEEVLVTVPTSFPLSPPRVSVEHDRFVGHPHVLQGDRLCVYLDQPQEWHPTKGVVGFLNRLWDWLDDAAAGRFDPRTALYHPVGGVLHATAGTPTVVVRHALDDRRPFGRWWLHARTARRLDLLPSARMAADLSLNVVTVSAPLRYGAGSTLAGLCLALSGIDHPKVTNLLYVLAQTAARNPAGSPLYFALAVPPTASSAAGDRHLVCGRLPTASARWLRDAAQARGPMLELAMFDVPFESPIEWCTVSEERQAMSTRRDDRRPVNAYAGTHVVLWGCGGLGSWVGEFLARAGVARLTLCDPATITGGLLVRQDYTELDVGAAKADALAARLRSIRDDLDVEVVDEPFRLIEGGNLPECDVLVDATVSNAVASGMGLFWDMTVRRPLVARLSTDRATSTLGLLTITRPGAGPPPEEADRRTGEAVAADPALEPYRCFWEAPDPEDEIVPAPGCSVPTFHGSGADLAAVAGTLVSLLGPHLSAAPPPGSHLVALPHSDTGAESHRWISFTPPPVP